MESSEGVVAKMIAVGGPVVVGVLLLVFVLIALWRYIGKDAVKIFQTTGEAILAASENCRQASTNNKVAAESNSKAAETHLAAGKLLETHAQQLQRLLDRESAKDLARANDHKRGRQR